MNEASPNARHPIRRFFVLIPCPNFHGERSREGNRFHYFRFFLGVKSTALGSKASGS